MDDLITLASHLGSGAGNAIGGLVSNITNPLLGTSTNTQTSTTTSTKPADTSKSNTGMIILVISVVVILAGVGIYFFKTAKN